MAGVLDSMARQQALDHIANPFPNAGSQRPGARLTHDVKRPPRVEHAIVSAPALAASEFQIDVGLSHAQATQRQRGQPIRKMRIEQQRAQWCVWIEPEQGLNDQEQRRRSLAT